MLKHKKVDITTLGQVNQPELIRAVFTFERVDYKTEISKYLYSRIHCFDYILCSPQNVSKKTHSRKNNKQRAQTANTANSTCT